MQVSVGDGAVGSWMYLCGVVCEIGGVGFVIFGARWIVCDGGSDLQLSTSNHAGRREIF